MSKYKIILRIVGLIVAVGLPIFGQDGESDTPKTEAYLVDEFGRMGDCQLSGRMDNFLTELQDRSGAQGYIIVYASVETLPGDIDDFGYGKPVGNHIAFRRFDASRITLLRGGFRQALHTELWIVPSGANPPEPRDTVPDPVMAKDRTVLFDRNTLFHEAFEISEEHYLLESFRQARDAEFAQVEDEASLNDTTERELQSEPLAEDPDVSEGADVDPRSPKEIEAAKFDWLGNSFIDYLNENPTVSATLIVYADDQKYDIGKLVQFIEQGRSYLTRNSNVSESRIRILYGGYKDWPECEFWIVPKKGDQPTAKPSDRPAPEPESIEN